MKNEFDEIIGLLQVIKVRKFCGKNLGFNIYMKWWLCIQPNDNAFVHEYIDFQFVKKSKSCVEKTEWEPKGVLKLHKAQLLIS